MFVVTRMILVMLLCCSLTSVAAQKTATTKEKIKTKTTNTAITVKNKSPVEHQHNNEQDNWADIFHQTLANTVYQSAFWFDSFFTLDENEQQPPKTSAKIRLGWLPKANDISEFETRFRIKVSLPNLKNRADLIFSDDSEDQLSDLPLETFNSAQNFSQESFSAAIRYVNKREKNKFTDTRLGISAGDVFVRLRHKRRYFWHIAHGFKFEPALYYFIGDGLGARLLLEYSYQKNETHQYRVNYSIRASEAFRGQKWKYGLYSLKQLSDQRANMIGLVAEGRHGSEEGSFTDKYTLSYRYRFNALRTWLFFEVEPFLEWAKEDDFITNPGIALRVEGYFEKK